FIGFESAATLGGEALRPAVVVPRAMRTSLLLAGVLFLIWAVVLPEGLAWLPSAQRSGLDPLRDLADQLGQPGAGVWIEAGAFLCLFGTCLGSLTALGRVSFALAAFGVLPARLARVHPRFGTPAAALAAIGLPLMLAGALPVARGVDVNRLFNLFGSSSVLAFLVVYGLVALAGLRAPLPGSSSRRRLLVAGACLLAVGGLALAYLFGVWQKHAVVVLSFTALLAVGWWRAWRLAPQPPAWEAKADGPPCP
ncbi:MAG: APC family permease, partial [Cyanobium sp.]